MKQFLASVCIGLVAFGMVLMSGRDGIAALMVGFVSWAFVLFALALRYIVGFVEGYLARHRKYPKGYRDYSTNGGRHG